jgi:hypothetical protein
MRPSKVISKAVETRRAFPSNRDTGVIRVISVDRGAYPAMTVTVASWEKSFSAPALRVCSLLRPSLPVGVLGHDTVVDS